MNPLAAHLAEWSARIDVAVLGHGFADHGRDYTFVIQNPFSPRPGTYRLILTHVVNLRYETRVRDDVWPDSWDEAFVDYERWEAAGAPSGYVWGTNWSLAYPGFEAPETSERAASWSARLGKPMHEMSVETDRFLLSVVFHDFRVEWIGDDIGTVERVIIPLNEGNTPIE